MKRAEATWPRADAVIGNPPFVGDKKMRAELGDEYTEALRKVYEGRVPGGADANLYWLFKRTGGEMRAAIQRIDRFIASPETPTHIVFAWQPRELVPDKNLIVIPRADDATMGLLCSRFHFL